MDLWLAYRAGMDVRLYPTIWRIRLLLTSRVWQHQKDTQIWLDEANKIKGFAMLWRRYPDSPWLALEGFIRPTGVAEELIAAMLRWGELRAQEIALAQQTSLTLLAGSLTQHPQTIHLMVDVGFTPVPPNPDEFNVYCSRGLQAEINPPQLPAGFAIRRLLNSNELEAYRAIFSFARVNPLHQYELIESDEYAIFVIVNPEANFAAYCECSICRAEWEMTGKHLGWIDYIETMPRYQNKGLGRAALLAGCGQLKAWGAQTVMLATTSSNASALSLYQKTGFERLEVKDYPVYQKTVP